MATMRYRLALDLGSTSLGWAMIRLNQGAAPEPIAVIKTGVRIFSDGRNPKDGSSLAVTRREARAMRRRRDRLLKRKARMTHTLIEHGFFPVDEAERKALVTLNPYALRAKGLNEALTPAEFARALFHINQRRGFKSNRKTDKKDVNIRCPPPLHRIGDWSIGAHRRRVASEWAAIPQCGCSAAWAGGSAHR
jgi:CRISPR-associated endonuclease Csn1